MLFKLELISILHTSMKSLPISDILDHVTIFRFICKLVWIEYHIDAYSK